MPTSTQKKTTSAKKRSPKSSPKPTAKTAAKAAPKPAKSNKDVREQPDPSSMANTLIPYIIGFIALFITICYVAEPLMGLVGSGVKTVFYGLFSGGAITIPVFLLIIAFLWRRDIVNRACGYKTLFAFICLLQISVMVYIGTRPDDLYDIKLFWANGRDFIGGGAVGGTVGWLLLKATGSVGTVIIASAILFLFGVFLFGLTPYTVYIWTRYHVHEYIQRRRILNEQRKYAEPPVRYRPPTPEPEPEPEPQQLQPALAQPVQRKPERNKKDLFKEDLSIDDPVVTAPVIDKRAGSFEAASFADEPDVDEKEIISEPQEINPIDQSVFEAAMKERDSKIQTESNESDDSDGKAGESEIIKPVGRMPMIKKSVAEEFAAMLDADDGEIDDEAINPAEVESVNSEGDSANSGDNGDGPLSSEMIRRLTEHSNGKSASKADSDGLELTRSPAAEDKLPKPAPEYVFPPVTLLKQGDPPDNSDISEELQTTAKNLVDTLASFKVHTRIINVSRGPTITRYELAPEEGTRVRSISNLVDDISLNVAATVRIEAPIPGKKAVGIEVPNRVVATVWLRELIDDQKFRDASSRITACLGQDVAGEPVYIDIAKMPHLLIAGATGMGKSVCINSMIVSLLYKASPKEVKLILIDPKKVELSIYNGLPHLLVPVVSDPQKAAGSLSWAVGEMERRYNLIEEVGVRDIKGYNAAIKDDPDKEMMPQVVIIIDELADLMMMAKDNVEESICRLAQKARAAGMHLIIGTQRPEVKVITGLIKANIPSRIAFTMVSQVDSRTVIDVAGAEKLIGRGDMLYAPVSAQKPYRVQGAFVTEGEIDSIIEFIKTNYGANEYDEKIIDSIEREAAKCVGSKKDTSAAIDSDDGEEYDPMLKPAIELAVDSGKISTSLIQRRMQLGYGRAAKLIDRMEQMGIVSAPEGQKPRTVLITRQQYMEMVLNGGGDVE